MVGRYCQRVVTTNNGDILHYHRQYIHAYTETEDLLLTAFLNFCVVKSKC